MASISIRVLDNAQRCMQRLGFLKHLLARCSQTATSDIASLGNDLLQTVTRKVSVPASPHVKDYAARALTDRLYKDLRRTIEQTESDEQVSVELQDAYLASPEVPSRRGKLAAKDWNRYPYLAPGLGLVRKGTYSLMVKGQVLLALTPPEELSAFKNYGSRNPLILDYPQSLFLLFTLLEHDADILVPLYRHLLTNNAAFSDRDAGDLLPDVILGTVKRLRPMIRTGDEIARLQRLTDTAKTIEQWRGRTYTGKGAREETVTVRLEPLVDVGVLRKADPFAYKYEFSPGGRELFSNLNSAEDAQDFLDARFFSAAASAFEIRSTRATELQEILPPLVDAFNTLKSAVGYAPIRDITLLAATRALTQQAICFEVSQGLEALKALQQERPDVVRFNVDRWGNLTFVKFTRNPLD